MTAPGAPRPPFQRLRRALLVVLALLIAGVAGLYLLGRSAAPPIEREGETDSAAGSAAGPGKARRPSAERDAVLLSEGFEYEQRIGERSAFRLRGERFATDREGVVTLQGVGLALTRENGDSYQIESRRAVYDPRDQSARLAGEVRLSGARGLHLTGEKLDLVRGGRTVVSRGPVRFGLGTAYSGDAAMLRFDFEDDHFLLRGGVRVHGAGAQPTTLRAEQVVFERPLHLVRATGRARLTAGGSRIRAHRIDAQLDSDDGEVQRATAVGGVAGQLLPASAASGDADDEEAAGEDQAAKGGGEATEKEGGEATEKEGGEATAQGGDEGPAGPPAEKLHFEGATLHVDFSGEPRQASAIDLEGEEGSPAQLAFHGADAGVRTLTAPHVVAVLDAGKLHGAAATGGVRLTERRPGAVERTATSDRAEATFDDAGELASVRLTDRVTLEQAPSRAEASEATIDTASGRARLKGGKDRVRVTTERGELRAPEVELERDGGKLHARKGVLALLRPRAGSIGIGPAGPDARQPIRVESAEADADDAHHSWEFRGDVRAAQGEDLLFADRLAGTEDPDTLSASGSVRTVTRQAGGGGPEATTTISADGLTYDRAAARIEYTGSVRVRQEGREMTSEHLVIDLDDQQRATRMTATGSVRIEDRAAGRTVTGQSAVHDLEARTILVEGDPVVLTEKAGGTVRGHRLLYDLAAGSARVLPDPEAKP
jgi:lipopolysaccharide transport protein LptA